MQILTGNIMYNLQWCHHHLIINVSLAKVTQDYIFHLIMLLVNVLFICTSLRYFIKAIYSSLSVFYIVNIICEV